MPDDLIGRARRLRDPAAPADPTLASELGGADPSLVARAGRLLAAVPAARYGRPDPKPLRVAVTATFTTDGVAPMLRVLLAADGIAADVYESGFDQTMIELSDPGSPLAGFRPDLVLVLLDDEWLLPRDRDAADPAAFGERVGDRLAGLEAAVAGFADRSGAVVALHTVPLSSAERRVIVAHKGKALLGRVWREVNGTILAWAERHPQVHVLDLEAELVEHPGPRYDSRLRRFASMAWQPGVELCYARQAAGLARALVGRSRKVLVLDLDNTLWGGVVGDDGPDGIALGPAYPGNCHTDLQRRARALRQQGVVLAIASKNDPAVVDEVFAHHPDMVLAAADFVARAVNWEPKDGNLRRIAEELNLGLDSVVFADDSAFECGLVAGALPQVQVVHLAGDPAGFVDRLLADGAFDTLTTTDTDRARTTMYRSGADRKRYAATAGTAEDYLRGLDLRVTVREADEFSLPRIVQLGLRTNQFTMTPTPHPQARTAEMAAGAGHRVYGCAVTDRFGTEGIVGAVWVSRHADHWLIENFVLSCRVFARGVEHAVLQHVVDEARADGADRLDATFRRTARNEPGSRLYPAAGFTQTDDPDLWTLALDPRPRIAPDWITVNGEENLVNA